MSKSHTIKIRKYLKKNQRKPSDLICTIESLAKYLGMSYQSLYNRFKNHKWTKTDKFALSKIIDPYGVGNFELSLRVKKYLSNNKQENKKNYITVKQVATRMNMSLSLFYKRCRKHNWNEEEKIYIDSL